MFLLLVDTLLLLIFITSRAEVALCRDPPAHCLTMHSKQSIKSEAPPHVPVCAMRAHVLSGCSRACVELTSWVLLCDALAEVQLLPYLNLSSLPLAGSATVLTMRRLSTDSIWSDLRKRTGTITLFSFFRWVPSERRKEGRGEEVNKPSAFLQKNKETLDRHLHFSMK